MLLLLLFFPFDTKNAASNSGGVALYFLSSFIRSAGVSRLHSAWCSRIIPVNDLKLYETLMTLEFFG